MATETKTKVQLQMQDVPGLAETFADTVGPWHFDGSTLRIEFHVTRLDQSKTGETRRGLRLPACRLVLTAAGTLELINQTQRILAALEHAGLVKSGKPVSRRTEIPN